MGRSQVSSSQALCPPSTLEPAATTPKWPPGHCLHCVRPSSSDYNDLAMQGLHADAVSAVRLFAGAFGLAVPDRHLAQLVSVMLVPTVWVHSPSSHGL